MKIKKSATVFETKIAWISWHAGGDLSQYLCGHQEWDDGCEPFVGGCLLKTVNSFHRVYWQF